MNDLDQDSPSLSQDDLKKIGNNFKIKLKKHQETSIKAMLNLEQEGRIDMAFDSHVYKQNIYTVDENPYYNYYRNRPPTNYKHNEFTVYSNFGILADKVGSGKTFEVIGLLCHTLVPIDHPKIISSYYWMSVVHKDTERSLKTNLVIVPHNIASQWRKAFAFTKLKVYNIYMRSHIEYLKSSSDIYEGNERNIKEKQEASTDSDHSDIDIKQEQCIGYYDVVLISSTMVDEFYEKFPYTKWARIILDEVTTLRGLPVSFDLKCNFVWYITATPLGLFSVRRNFIKEMIYNMNIMLFKRIIIKNSDAYITESMNLPALNQIIIHCDTPISLRAIQEFVPQDVMNMLNAGNIREAITRLNCNIDTEDNIINVLTNRTEKELHNKKQELDYNKRIIPVDARNHAETIKRIEEKIRSLETRLQSMKDRIRSFASENCQICLSDFTTPCVLPCCSNIFCLPCLTMVNGKCPVCRTPFNMNSIHIIDNEVKKAEAQQKKLLSKRDNLINIIKKKEHGRFLVFSNYDATNDSIGNFLDAEGIKYGKLAGNYNVINSTLEKFKNGMMRVLILNAHNYGSGLNLQMATDIIIYHEMPKELETQVIGRSQRMGRTQPLNVYYLLYENERSNCDNPNLDLNIFEEDDKQLLKLLELDNNESSNTAIDLDDQSDDENVVTKPKRKGRKKVVA
jgi:hypothetical protein